MLAIAINFLSPVAFALVLINFAPRDALDPVILVALFGLAATTTLCVLANFAAMHSPDAAAPDTNTLRFRRAADVGALIGLCMLGGAATLGLGLLMYSLAE